MDVNSTSFLWQLPRMLEAISTAHFVALDLEFSGIQSKAIHRVETSEPAVGRKQTLQQRYEEVKEAAERYQILQIGLTCVEEDQEKGVYVARPYNLFLSPLVEEKLGIERIFSFQSGAVDFLLSHGFRIEAPFKTGVPYLSRLEEVRVRQIEESRNDKTNMSDILIKSEDSEAISFVAKVREDILKWKNRTSSYPDFLNIAPSGWFVAQLADRGLNNFQKRLVHQLVRAEHPDLVTVSKPGFIQIIAYDKKREDAIKKSKMLGFEEKITRQVGFRWIVEAMVGGDLSTLDPSTFSRNSKGEPFWVDLREVRRDFDHLRTKLSAKRTTLVGHNLFVDLVNFYQCFIGKLPDRVEEFQTAIHGLFPRVIDTKYLATYEGDSSNKWSGLKELDEDLKKLTAPVFETHAENSGYEYSFANHEAGFDSYLTARVLVRLSANLKTADQHDQERISDNVTSSEDGGVPVNNTNTLQVSTIIGQTVPNGRQMLRKHKVKKAKQPVKHQPNHTLFSHPSMFSVLATDTPSDDESEDDRTTSEEISSVHTINGFGTKIPPQQPAKEKKNKKENKKSEEGLRRAKMISPWESDFWLPYTNKLRVNGTVEMVCSLEEEDLLTV